MGDKPNQYKDYLQAQRGQAVKVGSSLEGTLDKAVRAQRDGAWESPEGDEFSAELSGRSGKLRSAGARVLAEFDERIKAEPEMVDEHDWRARWYQLHRMEQMGRGPV